MSRKDPSFQNAVWTCDTSLGPFCSHCSLTMRHISRRSTANYVHVLQSHRTGEPTELGLRAVRVAPLSLPTQYTGKAAGAQSTAGISRQSRARDVLAVTSDEVRSWASGGKRTLCKSGIYILGKAQVLPILEGLLDPQEPTRPASLQS